MNRNLLFNYYYNVVNESSTLGHQYIHLHMLTYKVK